MSTEDECQACGAMAFDPCHPTCSTWESAASPGAARAPRGRTLADTIRERDDARAELREARAALAETRATTEELLCERDATIDGLREAIRLGLAEERDYRALLTEARAEVEQLRETLAKLDECIDAYWSELGAPPGVDGRAACLASIDRYSARQGTGPLPRPGDARNGRVDQTKGRDDE
mgnify:CR=1 FL=1